MKFMPVDTHVTHLTYHTKKLVHFCYNFPMPEEPTATQEPTEPTSEVAAVSEPLATSPVAPESPIEAESAVPVNNDNEQISPTEARNPATEQTVQIEEVEGNKPVSEATTQPTAQMAGNEPLAEPESKSPIPTKTYKNHTKKNLTKAQLPIKEKKRKNQKKIIKALNNFLKFLSFLL